jgi:FkbM family methyltransferase
MRPELLWKPGLLCERLAERARQARRRAILRGSVAEDLSTYHLESLEFLQMLRSRTVRTIHDIGACVGTWTLLAKAIFPAASVEAFEPLNAHVEQFERETKRLSSVRLHRMALGARAGEAMMNVTSFSDASSLLPLAEGVHGSLRVSRYEPVQISRLDDLVGAGTVLPPDLIKLDVQGYELEVLNGAARTLESAHALITEVSFVEHYRDQGLFHDVVSFLGARDFRLCAFSAGTLIGRPLAQADALFMRAA